MNRSFLVIALFTTSMSAHAGSGPWTLKPREHNIYLGLDHFRYANFNGEGGAGVIASPVAASGLVGVWTIGMAKDLELELIASYESVRVVAPYAKGCLSDQVPDDFCSTTSGMGDGGARFKWRMLDETYGSVVSASMSAGIRVGEAYADKRNRLTTLGDGTTDFGVALSVGRADGMGKGWYRASLDAEYWYRLANSRDGGKVPADEVGVSAEWGVSVHPRFALGPAAAWFTRLGGEPFNAGKADFNDLDVWGRLNASQIKLGAKLGVFSTDGGPTLSVGVFKTVYAKNNPNDTVAVSVGVGKFIQPKRQDLFEEFGVEDPPEVEEDAFDNFDVD